MKKQSWLGCIGRKINRCLMVIFGVLMVIGVGANARAGSSDTTVPIWIIGDSTVCNYAASDAHRGWGQVIGELLINGSRVDNRARSGASSKSYIPVIDAWSTNCFWGDGVTHSAYGRSGLKEDIANADTSKGGYLFIQFGHNDQFKSNYDASKTTVPGLGNEFDSYIMEYINFAKAHNVTPVLITPMARMFTSSLTDSYIHIESPLSNCPAPWDSMNGQTGDWPQTLKDIGAREGVIVLDLTTASKNLFATFPSNQAILDAYSWNQVDVTHFNLAGARKMAELIRDLAVQADPNLAAQFISNSSSSTSTTIGPRTVTPTPLSQGNMFAAPNGTGDGSSADNPTDIYTALTHLTSTTVLFLRGGTYAINQHLLFNSAAGTASQPIIIESYPGEHAILDGNYNANACGLELRYDNDYIAIRNIEIKGMVDHGILIRGSHVTVEGCKIHDNQLSGIHIMDGVNGGTAPFAEGYNIIRDNIVYSNSDAGLSGGNYNDGNNADGIAISSGKFNEVYNNEVYGNSDDGIDCWHSNDTTISYNLVHGNGLAAGDGNGIKTGGEIGTNPTTGLRAYAHHNISYNNRSDGFDLNAGTDVTWEYNTSYNNSGRGYNNITNDTIVRYNIASGNGISPQTQANTTDNSWQMSGTVTFISTDPASADFLRPTAGGGFENVGAYAGSSQPVTDNADYLNVANWSIYDGDPAAATISKVVDPDDSSNLVIQLSGNATAHGYKYTLPTPETANFNFSWKMKYNEFYVVYVSCSTTAGDKLLIYKPMDSDSISATSIVHGLGSTTQNNQWVTITRNLQDDLHDALPDVNITSVNTFMIRGSGYLDEFNFAPIVVQPTVVADAGADTTLTKTPSVQSVHLDGSNSSGDIVQYEWWDGNSYIGPGVSRWYNPSTPGTHTIKLIVTSSDGTTAEDTMILTVIDNN